jgi:Subtilase family
MSSRTCRNRSVSIPDSSHLLKRAVGQFIPDMTDKDRKTAERLGFVRIDDTRLSGLEMTVTRLRVPAGMTAHDGLVLLEKQGGGASYDYGHYFGLNVGAASGVDARSGPVRIANRRASTFRIGMIDTAVAKHPTLAGVRVTSSNFSGATGEAPVGHGTAIASLLANDGAREILSANVFKASTGKPFASAQAIVGAIDWLVASRVDVINVSLGGPRNVIVDRAIEKAGAGGHLVVAAAGNGGPTAPPAYPAAVPGAVAVTAVDKTGQIYRYANRGEYIRFAAHGVRVAAAVPDGSVALHSGTSFAAPHVSAELARCRMANGTTSGQKCVVMLQSGARDLGQPGRDPVYGHGVVE